jgi:carboxyl-terminal processing protease
MMDAEKNVRTWLPLWLALAIVLGIFIGNKFLVFERGIKVAGTEKLNAVLSYIGESYVDPINMRGLVEDALPHIVRELDPHSAYIPAEEMKRVNEELESRFSGIGVSFYVLNDTIVVTGIIPGGPSEAAGIQPWDRIVEVNDTLVAGINITNEQVVKKLRGERGTQVKLGIIRPSENKMIHITVTRGDIPVSSVQASYMLTDDIGYIKVGTFAFTTFSEFISAISKLKNQQSNSFVIDLRGNSGGSLETVVSMANEFLNKGELIVYAEGRRFPRIDYYADGSGTCKNDQIVVLIDELSASASEIFAGAMQDHDRGLIIGRKSFGKGLVQSQRQFKDGSAIRLTVARYYTPSGRSIQRKYEKGHYDEYEMDAINRYIQGDYINVDTASNVDLKPYKTVGGRTVYGGDGIMPDIFIPRDTTGINPYFNALISRDLVQEYAMVYSDRNREKLGKFSSWEELHRYLRMQPLLINLVSYADSKGVRQRPYYIEESRKLLETQLEAYIIRNFWGEEGFYAVLVENDNVVDKAIEMIVTGKTAPEAIVRERYKE